MKNFVFGVTTLLATVLATTSGAQAQSTDPQYNRLRTMIGLGASTGGDNLAVAKYANGTTDSIKAGGGVYFTVGADYRLSPELSLQGTVNFHVDDNHADNGSVKFQRFPVEFLAYYNLTDEWRIGGGVRYVSGAKLSSSGAASGIEAKFDNTTSGVIETEYFWVPNVSVKLRYVNETYKLHDYGEVKANHVGISANAYF